MNEQVPKYYKLVITTQIINPDYDEQKKRYDEDRKYNYTRTDFSDVPQPTITKNMLEVILTEEQFEVVRKSVLETYK